jgi:hypothetical protein
MEEINYLYLYLYLYLSSFPLVLTGVTIDLGMLPLNILLLPSFGLELGHISNDAFEVFTGFNLHIRQRRDYKQHPSATCSVPLCFMTQSFQVSPSRSRQLLIALQCTVHLYSVVPPTSLVLISCCGGAPKQ